MSLQITPVGEQPVDPHTTWRGVRTMAGHEFRLRLRAGRWRWLLVVWLVVLFVFTLLTQLAVGSFTDEPGGFMFGALMVFIIGLALLIVPALTAQSINGDRERGVLATLQTTLLTPAEIALGKLAAAWGTALVFLVLSLPFVVWCMLAGGVPVLRALVCFVITALLLGVVAAIAQCLSALLARSTTSAVLSYLAVFTLTIGTLIAFGLATLATQTTEQRTERYPVWEDSTSEEPDRWETSTYEATVAHPERVWWLLAPNPFVIVADATPATERTNTTDSGDIGPQDEEDPLRTLGDVVRQARDPDGYDGATFHEGGQKALWPYGLAFDLVLGAGAVAITIKRLSTPYRKMPRGVRVA